jgi:polyphenol oxidase
MLRSSRSLAPLLILGSDHVYRSPRLLGLPWLTHGFGTRLSPGWPGDYTSVKQVHSATVFDAGGEGGCLGQGDAIVSREPGVIVGVRTADCVPVLLVDPNLRVVAAVHAGWRGTVQRIVPAAVAHMGADPTHLLAVIGPCIGECCYEVGPEVSERFRSTFPERPDLGHVDLSEANRRQLLDAGLSPGNIELSGLCTRCNPDLDSFRRDGEAAGRMVAAIGIL